MSVTMTQCVAAFASTGYVNSDCDCDGDCDSECDFEVKVSMKSFLSANFVTKVTTVESGHVLEREGYM